LLFNYFPVPPRIDYISGNQTVNETDSVTLFCNVSGNPTPTTNWTRLSDNSFVSLPLQNIRRQDRGGYRCTADNDVGSPATKETFITVQCECYEVLIGALVKNNFYTTYVWAKMLAHKHPCLMQLFPNYI